MPQFNDAMVLLEQAAPSTPASGFGAFYFKSDSRPYAKSDAGVEYPLSAAADRVLRIVLDGGGSAITTGAKKAYLSVPAACTIVKWRILADVSGSIVLDLWKDTYANYPPTVADTITASAKPTLTTAIKAESSTLTGWTTALAAGDIIEVNVDSITAVTKVYLDLFVTT